MDERILTETFSKISKQYSAIRDILDTTDKADLEDLSIEVRNRLDDSSHRDLSKNSDKKQRMLMRMKHIERYMSFLTIHLQKVTATICDVPPYNVSLEILEDSCGNSINDQRDEWEKVTEEVYSTLNIESDDEDEMPDVDPNDFFDDDPPLDKEPNVDVDSSHDCPQLVTSCDLSDEEELDVSEIEIDKVKYYTTDEFSGKIYHILSDDKIGKKVGIFNEGVATFY